MRMKVAVVVVVVKATSRLLSRDERSSVGTSCKDATTCGSLRSRSLAEFVPCSRRPWSQCYSPRYPERRRSGLHLSTRHLSRLISLIARIAVFPVILDNC